MWQAMQRPCPRWSKRTCSRSPFQLKRMVNHVPSAYRPSSERIVTTQPIAPTLRLSSLVDDSAWFAADE